MSGTRMRRRFIAADPGPRTGTTLATLMAATGDEQALAQLQQTSQQMGTRLAAVETMAVKLAGTAAQLEPIRHASDLEHARLQDLIIAAQNAAVSGGQAAATATSNAATATTTAGPAASTANTAKSTADTAKTTADNAATAAANANSAAQQALARTVRTAYASVNVPILLLGASAANQTITWSPAFPSTGYSWTVADNAGLLARVTVSEVSRTATSITVKVTAGLLAVTVAGTLTLTAAMLV